MTASMRKQEMAFRALARTAGVYSEIHNSDKRIPRKDARKLIEVYFPFGASYFRERAN